MIVISYLTCAIVWGTTWFVIRESIAHDGQPGYPTYLASALRFTVATLILAAIVVVARPRPMPRTARQFQWLLAAGAVNGVSYALVYTAEQTLPGGLMAVLFGTIPLLTAASTVMLHFERVVRGQVWSAFAALLGIVVISWDGLQSGAAHVTAIASALGAVVASTAYSVLVRYGSRDVHPVAGTALFMSATTAVAWLFAAPEAGQMPWPLPVGPTVATLYLAIFGSVVAFACYFYLVKHVSLMTANSLVLIQPVIALLLDAALERHARLTPIMWVGVAVVLSGVVVNVLMRPSVPRRPSRS